MLAEMIVLLARTARPFEPFDRLDHGIENRQVMVLISWHPREGTADRYFAPPSMPR